MNRFAVRSRIAVVAAATAALSLLAGPALAAPAKTVDPTVAHWNKIDPTVAHWNKIDPTVAHWNKIDPTVAHWNGVSPSIAP
ncbi:MAG: hypothetical protein ACR2MA_06880 [Egibacteraceae bacterium]